MSLTAEFPFTSPIVPPTPFASPQAASEPGYQVIRRNGAVTPFDAGKIAVAPNS